MPDLAAPRLQHTPCDDRNAAAHLDPFTSSQPYTVKLSQRLPGTSPIRDDRDYAVHMDYIHFNPVNMASLALPRIGLSRHFTGQWRTDFIRRNGQASGPASQDAGEA
jgi:hypothetical protein